MKLLNSLFQLFLSKRDEASDLGADVEEPALRPRACQHRGRPRAKGSAPAAVASKPAHTHPFVCQQAQGLSLCGAQAPRAALVEAGCCEQGAQPAGEPCGQERQAAGPTAAESARWHRLETCCREQEEPRGKVLQLQLGPGPRQKWPQKGLGRRRAGVGERPLLA
jgi:hypothetical protein